MTARAEHTTHSVLREVIVEHLFIGQLLQHFWRAQRYDVEILRSEFDAHGHDLVIVCEGVTRHVQLKARLVSGKTARYKIAMGLANRPSGCVIVLEVEDDLTIAGYRFFGNGPGCPMDDISDAPVAKHTKANADGIKLDRQSQRVIPLGRFQRFDTLEGLAQALLG